MMAPANKDGIDCIKFTPSKDRELYITIAEMYKIGCGIRVRELTLGGELSFDEFRQLKREYRKEERAYMRSGRLMHLAKYSDEMWQQMNEDYFKQHGRYPKQRGQTYTKPVDTK